MFIPILSPWVIFTYTGNNVYSDSIKSTFKILNIPSGKSGHFGRAVGAKLAESKFLNVSEIKQVGNWNTGVMERVYSSQVPLDPIRKLAGHSGDVSSYFLARENVIPNAALRSAIFPFVDAEKEAISSSMLTACGVLNFFDEMRTVLLQDLACFYNDKKYHCMFDYHPFCSEEFKQFAKELKDYMEKAKSPGQVKLQEAAPEINNCIQSQVAPLRGELNVVIQKVDAQMSELEAFRGQFGVMYQHDQKRDRAIMETREMIMKTNALTMKNNAMLNSFGQWIASARNFGVGTEGLQASLEVASTIPTMEQQAPFLNQDVMVDTSLALSESAVTNPETLPIINAPMATGDPLERGKIGS